ncbi:hypothetical protein IGI04_035735 [Brassica rapa subsp. trilocularis]|uniref:Uncharacterized protein n=1 Tax=Brassica rapa subsp. trilocularis TaxID=1813537 RepID=A0ABQ7LF82_BRACM|nr:hypothetical protein IGI04_035735 [Brassica rapa subsp. trilocularis]
MVEGDEQHVSGELSRVEEADISDTSSASIATTTTTSTDGTTSTSTDGTTSTPTDGTISTSTNGTTSTSTDGWTTASTDGTTSTSTNDTTSTSVDDSTLKSIDISSCDPTSDGNREITIEDFLELEDGEKLEDLDSSREVTMEDFLELEEWLEDMDQNSKKKLNDDQHTSRGNLETSPKASIDRHQPDEIDRQPPHIIDQRPPYIIDRQSADSIDLHPHSIINRHPPDCIDRHPWLDELPRYIVELEQVEERMYMSKASHPSVHEHQRTPICAEKAVGFHKRVKRIHDPVRIVVPCAIFEVEFSIHQIKHVEASQRGLPFRDEVDKGPVKAASIDIDRIPSNDTNNPVSIDTNTSPSIDIGRISEQKGFDVCGNLFDGETTTRSNKSGGKKKRNWKKRKKTKGGSQLSLIPHFLDGVRKCRVRSRCFSQSFAKL